MHALQLAHEVAADVLHVAHVGHRDRRAVLARLPGPVRPRLLRVRHAGVARLAVVCEQALGSARGADQGLQRGLCAVVARDVGEAEAAAAGERDDREQRVEPGEHRGLPAVDRGEHAQDQVQLRAGRVQQRALQVRVVDPDPVELAVVRHQHRGVGVHGAALDAHVGLAVGAQPPLHVDRLHLPHVRVLVAQREPQDGLAHRGDAGVPRRVLGVGDHVAHDVDRQVARAAAEPLADPLAARGQGAAPAAAERELVFLADEAAGRDVEPLLVQRLALLGRHQALRLPRVQRPLPQPVDQLCRLPHHAQLLRGDRLAGVGVGLGAVEDALRLRVGEAGAPVLHVRPDRGDLGVDLRGRARQQVALELPQRHALAAQ